MHLKGPHLLSLALQRLSRCQTSLAACTANSFTFKGTLRQFSAWIRVLCSTNSCAPQQRCYGAS